MAVGAKNPQKDCQPDRSCFLREVRSNTYDVVLLKKKTKNLNLHLIKLLNLTTSLQKTEDRECSEQSQMWGGPPITRIWYPPQIECKVQTTTTTWGGTNRVKETPKTYGLI